MNGTVGKLIPFFPLLFLIFSHDALQKYFLLLISSPIFTTALGIIGFFFAYLGFFGISFRKKHQLNPSLRSIVSYPIAIQLKDQTPLNEQQIYDTVIKCCSNSQIFFEQTSIGFKAKKAEIIVIDWEKYEERDIENKRNELHLKIIEALTNKAEKVKRSKELEVLNFTIEHRHDGHIENVIPIENNATLLYRRTSALFRLFIHKIGSNMIYQSICKLKIGRMFTSPDK